MEISGEINIEIDQYQDFEVELDVDRLAEELATDHNFVDDAVLHAHVEEYCDSYVADRVSERVQEETQELRTNMESMAEELDQYELRVQVDDLDAAVTELAEQSNYDEFRVRIDDIDGAIDELRHQVSELQPDNNYVRINDLRDLIDAQVDVRVTGILNDVVKGIEQYRKGNNA